MTNLITKSKAAACNW